jgi:hypothetical protein
MVVILNEVKNLRRYWQGCDLRAYVWCANMRLPLVSTMRETIWNVIVVLSLLWLVWCVLLAPLRGLHGPSTRSLSRDKPGGLRTDEPRQGTGELTPHARSRHTRFRRSEQRFEFDEEEWQATYRRYLRSAKWRRVRARVLRRDQHTCQICGGKANQVHHIQYPRSHQRGEFTREQYDYLEAVCGDCHMKEHGLR